MEKNVGAVDRVMRVGLGLLIASAIFIGPRTPWALVGLIVVGTGLLGWCPLYEIVGMNTRATQRSSE